MVRPRTRKYYDPDSARFISQDSYLGEAGTPPSPHRYLYAYSNPTVFVDIAGYMSLEKHMDSSSQALALAVERGDFVLPQGMIGRQLFKSSIQIGSTFPDLQSREAATAVYGASVASYANSKMPWSAGDRAITGLKEKVAVKASEAMKWLLSSAPPGAMLTVEMAGHAWSDSSAIEPVVALAAKKNPGLKQGALYQEHFGDAQWQHGMGVMQKTSRLNS